MRECRDEGELRAFLDGELPSGVVAATETHVQTCRDCRQELAQLEANRTWAGERLAALAPRSEVGPSAGQAWARLNERARVPTSWKERVEEMFGLVNRRWRPALVGLALIAVLALAFSLEPVRVAAGDFLSIFRVRQFAVIPMGPEQMERMEEINALLEQSFFLSEPIMLARPEPRTVPSVEEASQAVGFAVRTPRYLPERFASVPRILVTDQVVGQFEVDLELARSLLELVELDPALLPDSLNERPLELVIPPMAWQSWRYESRTGLDFAQGPSPTVDFPDDVDPAALATAALRLLGMDDREAQRLSQTIDWTTTLVLPIPTDIVSFREVSIDGTTGLLISEKYDDWGSHSALMWQKGGIIYFLEGNLSTDALMDVAASIP